MINQYITFAYSLLLKLQGDMKLVTDVYESAISSLHDNKDVQDLWLW